jgi:hypothetical protein
MKLDGFAVERDKITRAPVHPGVFFERNILPEFRRQNRTIGRLPRCSTSADRPCIA